MTVGAMPADQHDVGLLRDLVGHRLQKIGVQDLVPVRQVAEQERRVDEGSGFGEGRHVGRRDDGVVDRLALRHVLEILLLEAERRVTVQDEVDRLAVIFLHQLFEPEQRLVEGVVVVELHGAVQRDRRLGVRTANERGGKGGGSKAAYQDSAFHRFLQGPVVSEARPCGTIARDLGARRQSCQTTGAVRNLRRLCPGAFSVRIIHNNLVK
jgi:hypothetical protein